jgi:MFS superfamily sulfate permease-like transporter
MSRKDLVVPSSDAVPRYTKTDLENARTKGQLLGWLQGAGVTFALMFVIGLIGWIPGILVGAVLAFILVKLLKR